MQWWRSTTLKKENRLSETVTGSAVLAPFLEGDDELLTTQSWPSTGTRLLQSRKSRGTLVLIPTSVRASWITTTPKRQDARPEANIRGVFPWSDHKVTLTYIAMQATRFAHWILKHRRLCNRRYLLQACICNVKMAPPMLSVMAISIVYYAVLYMVKWCESYVLAAWFSHSRFLVFFNIPQNIASCSCFLR